MDILESVAALEAAEIVVWMLDLGATLGWLALAYTLGARLVRPRTAPARLRVLGVSLAVAVLVRFLLAVFLYSPHQVATFLMQDFVLAVGLATTTVLVCGLIARKALFYVRRQVTKRPPLQSPAEVAAVVVLVLLLMLASGAELALHGTRWRMTGGPTGGVEIAISEAYVRNILDALVEYRRDHGGAWPADLRELFEDGLDEEFRENPRFREVKDPWVYVPPPEVEPGVIISTDIIVIYERVPGDIDKLGIIVGFTGVYARYLEDRRAFAAAQAESDRAREAIARKR